MCAPLVVFDIGSTLVAGPAKGPASRIAKRLGLHARQKSLLHSALMTRSLAGADEVAELIRREYGVTDTRVDQVVSEVWAAQEDEAVPLPGAAEAITGLVGEGYRFALVSNIWLPYLASARQHFGWFFDDCVPTAQQIFSFREGHAKPSPELLRRALSVTGVPAHRAVMVGDSYLNDIAPATALGMRTIWLLHQPQKEAVTVARVVNRAMTGPSLALGSIAELSPGAVSSVFTSPADHPHDCAAKLENPG